MNEWHYRRGLIMTTPCIFRAGISSGAKIIAKIRCQKKNAKYLNYLAFLRPSFVKAYIFAIRNVNCRNTGKRMRKQKP